jgi:hypothetical protein
MNLIFKYQHVVKQSCDPKTVINVQKKDGGLGVCKVTEFVADANRKRYKEDAFSLARDWNVCCFSKVYLHLLIDR